MNKSLRDCILLESEKQVVGDVTDSLSLLRIPVRAHSSVEDALIDATRFPPMLIMARLKVGEDHSAGIRLGRELAAHPVMNQVPRIAMYLPGEQKLFPQELSFFYGTVELPVEFPTFTKRIQKFLDTYQQEHEDYLANVQKYAESREASEEDDKAEIKVNGNDTSAAVHQQPDRRLVVAHAIQAQVLERLREHNSFQSARVEEVPQIVADVTREICGKMDPKKLF